MTKEKHNQKMENAKADILRQIKKQNRQSAAIHFLEVCDKDVACALRFLLKANGVLNNVPKQTEPLGIFKDLQETVDELNNVLTSAKAAESAKEACK